MIKIPFSPDYSKNRDRYNQGSDDQPCIICGKLVKDQNNRYSVHVHEGGTHIVTEEEAATMDEASDLGFYPIGLDCLRQHPELRPYVHDGKPSKCTQKASKDLDWQALYFDLYRQVNGENAPDSEIMADANKRTEILEYQK